MMGKILKKTMMNTNMKVRECMSDFQNGMRCAKELIECIVIGLQNENGNNSDSETYKAYQKVLELIQIHFENEF